MRCVARVMPAAGRRTLVQQCACGNSRSRLPDSARSCRTESRRRNGLAGDTAPPAKSPAEDRRSAGCAGGAAVPVDGAYRRMTGGGRRQPARRLRQGGTGGRGIEAPAWTARRHDNDDCKCC